jgi:glycosyltransferase involved in cell wall biosynthesis
MNTSKKSILYIISSLDNQGPVQVLYDIISYMDFDKYDVSIMTLGKEGKHTLIGKFAKLPIKIIQNENIGKYNIYKLFVNLKFYIAKLHIDILHSNCFRSLFLGFFFRKQVVCIHSIYIYPGIQLQAINGRVIGKIINLIYKYIIKKIKYSIACSKSVSEEFLMMDQLKVDYIRNGVTSFKRNNEDKNNFKRLLGLDPYNHYFISIGRLSPEKNFITLIEAFKKAHLENFKLIIIGDGILMKTLQRSKDENVILSGFKENISDYLAASDFYITTSLTEGMALSTIYAMSSGLPLLLSNIAPHKEIFELAGNEKIGVLFRNDRLDSIVDAIRKIAQYPAYNELSINVTNVFFSHFTAEKMSKSYQDLYAYI